MLEKDIENLLAKYPAEFFPNSSFKLKGQQVRLGKCFADIIFEDSHQRLVIVEVKRGILGRDAAGQVMEYYGLLKEEQPEKLIELVLCANVIPSERKKFLENVGIDCIEVGPYRLTAVAKKYGYTFLDDKEQTENKTQNSTTKESNPNVGNYDFSAGQNVWIFQANPQRYDIYNALANPDLNENTWLVQRYKQKIKKGDLALIWMSGPDAGIYATAEIIGEPRMMLSHPSSSQYWNNEEDKGEQKLRVPIKIRKKLLNAPIFRSVIKTMPGLQDLSILKNAQGTNFPVAESEWTLIKNNFLS